MIENDPWFLWFDYDLVGMTKHKHCTVPHWEQIEVMKWEIGSNYVNSQTWEYKGTKQVYQNISLIYYVFKYIFTYNLSVNNLAH